MGNIKLPKVKQEIEKEIWKKIEGFSMYEVSNLCRIRTIKQKLYCTQNALCTGYVNVNMYSDRVPTKKTSYFVHRIVATAFIANEEGKPCVNHIDGIKSNNYPGNLEWVTHKENSIHAHATGLNDVPRLKGVKHPLAKFSENDIVDILKMGIICEISNKKIAMIYDVESSQICSILNGKIWKDIYSEFIRLYAI